MGDINYVAERARFAQAFNKALGEKRDLETKLEKIKPVVVALAAKVELLDNIIEEISKTPEEDGDLDEKE